jgi:8-oxo-dGTP pyrophosphatase MutT (NUDIX family)
MTPDNHPDPRIAALRSSLAARSAVRLPRRPDQREAAVALLLRPGDTLDILLIRRAEFPGDPWSGHVALPGGRRDPADPDLLATARRETEEEVGVPLHRVGTHLGDLDEISPGTILLPPIVIAPFVLAVPPGTTARPDPREVQAAIWVPLDALRADAALSQTTVDLPGGRGVFPCLVYEDFVIWGLTFRILRGFLTNSGSGS